MKQGTEVGTMLLILLISFSSLALNVQHVKSEPTTIIVPDDFPTIQEAINNATDGDTILVRTGAYHEHVVINRTVSLVGEESRTTIIDGDGTDIVIDIFSDNVNVTGFTVARGGSVQLDAGICLTDTAGCNIVANRLIDNGFSGISLLNSQHNTITGNNVTGTGWGAIHLLDSTNNAVSRNTLNDNVYVGINGHASSHYNVIEENVITNSTYGMFYHNANYNIIRRNNISDIAVEGIWLQEQVSYNSVAGNRLTNCTVGIRLQGPNYNNTIAGNTLTDGQSGIEILNARYTEVCNNTITHIYGGEWDAGIRLDYSGYSRLHTNVIADNWRGILLYTGSPYVSIYGNNITENEFAVRVASGGSNYLNVSGNLVMNNRGYGIGVTGFGGGSNYATISSNLIVNNSDGIALGQYSSYNAILQNNISQNDYGFYIEYSTQNTIWRNNIVDNDQQVYVSTGSVNHWDGGYPSGGNYWSNYSGIDLHKGPFQNETGNDNIGDTNHVINGDNTDQYPLVNPYRSIHAVSTDVKPAKTIVWQNFSVIVDITLNNEGHFSETVNVTVRVNTTLLSTFNITLTIDPTIRIAWNTTGFAKGNYTISAYAEPVPGEMYTTDNLFADVWVIVAMVGDLTGPEEWPDGQCDMRDIGKIARLFGATPTHSLWDPNCDIDGDDKVDMKDIGTAARHFGKVDT